MKSLKELKELAKKDGYRIVKLKASIDVGKYQRQAYRLEGYSYHLQTIEDLRSILDYRFHEEYEDEEGLAVDMG